MNPHEFPPHIKPLTAEPAVWDYVVELQRAVESLREIRTRFNGYTHADTLDWGRCAADMDALAETALARLDAAT